MKHIPIAFAVAMLVGLAGPAAHAETIFRCGHEYSSVPCPDARTLVLASATSAEQRAEARDVARREKALAAAMSRDRREQEARIKPALAGSLSAPPVALSTPGVAAKKQAKKRKKNDPFDAQHDFIAVVPKANKPGP